MLNSTSNLNEFYIWYRSIHGYLSLIICLLGLVLNFFNIIVLTRRHMLSSTNAILTALAVCDFVVMFIYIPSSLKLYIINHSSESSCGDPSYFWTVYTLLLVNITVTMHSTSIWLTVLLAFFRYIYICHNKLGKTLCSRRNTNIAILVTYFFCICLSAPSYMVSKIEKNNNCSHEISVNGSDFYKISQSDIDLKLNGYLFYSTFFIQAFCVKLVPCLLILLLSSLLIYSIHKVNKINKKLYATGCKKRRDIEKSKEQTRTNTMLVLVCTLFFITEFPQGILAFLSIIFESTNFHEDVYMKLGDFMDMLSLLNSATNFILYCLMSNLFRKTFKNVFCLFLKEDDQNFKKMSRRSSAFYNRKSSKSFSKLLDS